MRERESRVERNMIIVLVLVTKCNEQEMDKTCKIYNNTHFLVVSSRDCPEVGYCVQHLGELS